MYTAIRHYKLLVKSLDDETRQRVEDEFVPILKSTDGFVEYHIAEAGDNEIFTVSVFETEEGARASSASAAKWVNDNLVHLVKELANVLTGEVIISGRR